MIYYICDKKGCGQGKCLPECSHTTMIERAANFERLENGDYVEKPVAHSPNAPDNFADLVKELNVLLDKYIQLRAIHFPPIEDFEEARDQIDKVCKAVLFSIECVAAKIDEQTPPKIVEIQDPALNSAFQEFIKQREDE